MKLLKDLKEVLTNKTNEVSLRYPNTNHVVFVFTVTDTVNCIVSAYLENNRVLYSSIYNTDEFDQLLKLVDKTNSAISKRGIILLNEKISQSIVNMYMRARSLIGMNGKITVSAKSETDDITDTNLIYKIEIEFILEKDKW